MLLGLVKWAYQRGVAHERLRIKRLIAEFNRESDYDFQRFNVLRRDGEKNLDEITRLEHKVEVNVEARHILDKLVRPGETEWVPKSPAPIDEGGE